MQQDHFNREFAKLVACFPTSNVARDPDRVRAAGAAYWERFKAVPAPTFSRAIVSAIEDLDYFPSIKKLRGFVLDHTPEQGDDLKCRAMSDEQMTAQARQSLYAERWARMASDPGGTREVQQRAARFASGQICRECGDVGSEAALVSGWTPRPDCPRCHGQGWDPDSGPPPRVEAVAAPLADLFGGEG